jgi:thiol-disulfide isomerase/thioredoxin
VAAAVAFMAAGCFAAKLNVGDAGPDWSGIAGVDGKDHSLADYKNAKLVVVVFTCNHCPVAVAYEDRLVALQKEYKGKGVQFVAINCNNIAGDRLDDMKKRAKDKGFNFPYLHDSTQKSGRDYDAKVTPHVFLLDKARKVAYMGAIDDNMNAEKVKTKYLADALDALLDGKEPPKTSTPPTGCSIKYEKK